MHVTKLIQFFRDNKYLNLKIRCNADQGSIWFSEEIDPEFIGNKMHIRHRETSTIISWFTDIMGTYDRLRLQYFMNDDIFTLSYLDTSKSSSKDISIEKFSTLADEALFFQESTMQDFGDLDSSDIPFIIELSNEVTAFAKGMIDANKTRSA